MRSSSSERGPLAAAGEARNRALLVAAAAMFIVLVGVEVLTLRTWVASRDATDELADRARQVGQLANIQREVAQLRYTAENVDEFVTVDELLQQRALLENHLRRFEGRWADGSRPRLFGELRVGLEPVDEWLAALEAGEVPDPASTSVAGAMVNDVEQVAKRVYDSAETPYFIAADAALEDRNRSNGFLLLASGLLGLFALLAVLAARRSARAQRDEAFDALAVTEARHREVLDSVKDVIFTTDRDGNWTYLSAAWERLTGVSVQESLGRNFLEMVHPDERESCPQRFAAIFEDGLEVSQEIRYLRPDGATLWVEVWAGPDDDHEGTYGTVVDITGRREFEERLHHQASHDALTGLPNREMLATHLDEVIDRSRTTGFLAGILFLDLDRFKLVNDGLGHDVGDLVLRQVADRISAALDDRGLIARLGGDEFVIVVEHLGRDLQTTLDAASSLSLEIEAAVRESVVVGNDRATITASVGITVSRPDARADELIAEADAAMYRAKSEGKARHEVFDEGLRIDADHRLHLEHALRGARSGEQLLLFHQPILDLRSGRVVGTEALLRWDHPARGIIGPDDFLSVAEEAGVMPDIGEWVIRTACADVSWMRELPGAPANLTVAVNLSVTELCSPGLVSVVERALLDARLDPEALCIEVTEHDVLEEQTAALDHLFALRQLGVRVSMDDFGTGYSSLAHLRSLPIDELKLDRAFVHRLTGDEVDADDAIVRAVADLSASMGLVMVAEGVESAEQLERLRLLGVDRVQGHHIARPTPRDGVARRLREEPVSSVRDRA